MVKDRAQIESISARRDDSVKELEELDKALKMKGAKFV